MAGRLSLLIVTIGVLGLGCASTDGSVARGELPVAAGEAIVARPYTANEIRAANPPGTTLLFRTTTSEGVSHEHFEFGETDGEVVELGRRTTNEQGELLESRPASPVSWTELRDHATFPAASTRESTARVSVTAGTFSCKRYAVTRPDGTLETYHFARERPGPPVLLTIERDGAVALRMELIEVRRPGS